jgi:hypothetical protein
MHLSYRCSNFLFNLENELDIIMNAPREYLPFAIGITKTVAIVSCTQMCPALPALKSVEGISSFKHQNCVQHDYCTPMLTNASPKISQSMAPGLHTRPAVYPSSYDQPFASPLHGNPGALCVRSLSNSVQSAIY